jgi:hypothetical protein
MHLNPYDYRHDPEPGKIIPDKILEKIKSCEHFVTFLTEQGVKSQWVNQEIGMAFASDRHIIPIVQENVRYEGVIEVKGIEYIPYSPSCCDDCIFEIIRTFRQLHNINP